MRTVLFLLFCFCSTFVHAQSPVVLTPQQMKADLDYLNKYLRKWHPAYYNYTDKTQMEAYYSRLKDSCNTDRTAFDFKTTVRKAVNQVHCGHMGVYDYKGITGKIAPQLPFKIWVLNNRLFIRAISSKDSLLHIGDEILDINGEKTIDVITKTTESAFTDALNTTHKMYSLEVNFSVYHLFVYDKQDNYTLTIKNRMGDTSIVTVKSEVPKETTATQKTLKDSANCLIKGNAVALYKTDFDASTMVIDIDHFNGKKQGKTFRQIFKHLRKNQIKNVVIDLRNNGGGSVFSGNKLLGYLLDAPIRPLVISRKPNLTFINPRFKGGLLERITPILFTLNPLQYPNKNGWNHCFLFFKKYRNHFDGNIYVLTNGGSFSMASYVASYLKYKKQAVIVGEETGGSEYGSRAMAGGHIKLPNSEVKIQLNIYQMTHLIGIEDKGHGLLPDHAIEYSIDDKLANKDLEIEKIKTLIKK
jgi:C-terminal processing protease CtpA/Prc